MRKRPEAAGLYDPNFEHDDCGIGAVADLTGEQKHETVARALHVLDHLEHRGASGAEIDTGDGAGILCQVPDEFFRAVLDFELPPPGEYAVGVLFLPRDDEPRRARARGADRAHDRRRRARRCSAGATCRSTTPCRARARPRSSRSIRQVFVGQAAGRRPGRVRAQGLRDPPRHRARGAATTWRSRASARRRSSTRACSRARSCRATTRTSATSGSRPAVALVHSRFSTNTFPSWELAHPYRMICHNGEINTLRGNINWMRARESTLASDLFGDDLEKVIPAVRPAARDSATFDNVLELLVLAGRSLPHSLMMMVPEAWENHDAMPELPARLLRVPLVPHGAVGRPGERRVLRRHAARRDARPQRPAARALAGDEGRLRRARVGDRRARVPAGRDRPRRAGSRPGKIFFVDLEKGRVVEDGEIKHEISHRQPYGDWYRERSRPPRRPRGRRARGGPRPTRSSRASSCSATRRRTCASRCATWAARRRRSRPARWATTSRSPSCPTRRPRSTPTSSSSSRRSRTRRSTRSASAS